MRTGRTFRPFAALRRAGVTCAVMLTLALAALAATPERPRDVWAFRSVLDRHPRMLTLALSKDLWAAYDATHAGLYKVWRGGVKFDGAVYTSAHGPQPTSQGAAFVTNDPDENPWLVFRNKDAKPADVRWRGYRFDPSGTRVTVLYDLMLDGRAYRVEEEPETEGPLAFRRTIRVPVLPRGTILGTKDGPGAKERESEGILRVTTLVGGENVLRYTFQDPSSRAQPLLRRQEDLTNGVAVRIYDVGETMYRIPELVGGQTPNASFLAPNVDFSSAKDFAGFESRFLVHVTGEIVAPVSGEYAFRLISDDGSRFTIRDEKIVDHDGLHSESPKDGRFTLTAGSHPFKIEMFQGEAEEVLRLQWRKPGDATWETIPSSAFRTPASEVRVTSPGKKRTFDPGGGTRPGDLRPEEGVHPSYRLATIRPETFRPRVGGLDFLPDGRLVVCNWEPDGGVYALTGVEGPDPKPTVVRIAKGLAEPLGIKTVGKRIYVLQKQELTELVDLNGDGVTDEYRCVANGWGVTPNFHEFAFGLEHERGRFYFNLATAIDPGGRSTQPQNPDRGRVIEVAPDGSYRFVAAGLRTPNGIGRGWKNRLFLSDNQGDWLPSSKILPFVPGGFYGNRSVDFRGTAKLAVTPPVVWLPQGEIGNSPSQMAPLNDGPYRGQMVHGDVTHGGLKRVFVEEVGGVLQGTVFRFTQGLEAGINRVIVGPDKALYVGGIGDVGNWGQEGKLRYGLQKLTYNAAPTFEMLSVKTRANGLEVALTEPLAPGVGGRREDWEVTSWRYVPNADYGGPKVDERAEGPKSVTVSRDRRTVFLELPKVEADRVYWTHADSGLASLGGRQMWATEAWTTVNRVPAARGRVAPEPEPPLNVLTPEEVREGFVSLFDGKDLTSWRGWRRPEIGPAWTAENGMIVHTPGRSGGDIRTAEKYRDFELRLDWRVASGGNSGIFFRADEALDPAWITGPEMQILDDERHPDGQNPLTSAGSAYAMVAPSPRTVRRAGGWNQVRLIVRGNRVEQWLNGVRVVEYEIGSPDWRARLARSKFASNKEYASRPEGYLVLQDHGDPVYFRNLRVRRL